MEQASISASPEQAVILPSPERASPEAAEVRWGRQVSAMLADAHIKTVEKLADVLAWGLAVIASQCGTEATGDIVWRLGRHIRRMAEQDRVQGEAEHTKQEGHAVQ